MSKHSNSAGRAVGKSSDSKYTAVDPDVGKKTAEIRCSFIKRRNILSQKIESRSKK